MDKTSEMYDNWTRLLRCMKIGQDFLDKLIWYRLI